MHIDSPSTQTQDIVKKSESSNVQDLQEQQVIISKESEQIKNLHIDSSSTQTLDIIKISVFYCTRSSRTTCYQF